MLALARSVLGSRVGPVVAVLASLAVLGATAAPSEALTPPGHDPIGHVDGAVFIAKYDHVSVWGWAGDLDAGSTPGQRVHVYIDGRGAAAVSTGDPRPDVQRVYPALGPDTGFDAYPMAPPGRGSHQVCVYAINRGPGGTTLLGCPAVSVTEPGALLGHIDSITVDPAAPERRMVTGWVLDPYDALSPTPFALAAGNLRTVLGGLSAGLPRPDVDRVYPQNGHDHGFSVSVPVAQLGWSPGATVCIAIDETSYFPGVALPTPYCFVYRG